MASAGKIIGVTAAVGVVGLGTYILITKAMEIDSLIKNIQFSVSVSKVRLEGYSHLKVYINVSIINPTKLSFKFERFKPCKFKTKHRKSKNRAARNINNP